MCTQMASKNRNFSWLESKLISEKEEVASVVLQLKPALLGKRHRFGWIKDLGQVSSTLKNSDCRVTWAQFLKEPIETLG